MVAIKKVSGKPLSAEQQLRGFITKFEPKYQTLIRSIRKALHKLMPTADELVYDNYNFFVIGYSATERSSDAIISLAAGASGLNVFFLWGARLPDPKKVLLGSGKQVRFVRVESIKTLMLPEVEAVIQEAIRRAKTPLRPTGRGKLIIKSISAKQRPRRRPSL